MIRKNFLGEKANVKCIGCDMLQGDFIVPGGILLESEHFIMHQDPEYAVESFFIITAKRHFTNYNEMTPEENRDLSDITYRTRKVLDELGVSKEYTMLIEERSKHFHVWFFPRLSWMEDFPRSLSSIRDIMNHAKLYLEDAENISTVMRTIEDAKVVIETKTVQV